MVTSPIAQDNPRISSLEDYLLSPPDRMEWVDGQLVEKDGMTLKASRVQSKLNFSWRAYKNDQNFGGEVYTEPPCRTKQRIRRPDIAYLTPKLLAQFGEPNVFPQSFPLVAEIVSPADCAEDVFSKANEYLESGCQEAWLVLPESQWIVVITQQSRSLFHKGETASAQIILSGFSIRVDELLG